MHALNVLTFTVANMPAETSITILAHGTDVRLLPAFITVGYHSMQFLAVKQLFLFLYFVHGGRKL